MRQASTEILRYALLPRFIPRIFALFTNGFSYTAYLIALIYQSLDLLPLNHPYLKPENFGKFGIRHVIAEAANNLVISRKNADQVLVFFTILVGLVLILVQFALLGFAFLGQPAIAFAAATGGDAPTLNSFYNVFSVNSPFSPGDEHPAQDLAFIIMDRVFGLVNIFDSCVSDTGAMCTNLQGNPIYVDGNGTPLPAAPYPMPFHIALHALLRFYSMGVFITAIIIILYYVITITAETAATGTPFGQRVNKAWAPVRLILFFALLVPLNVGAAPGTGNAGLNGAQIITFWVAKTGSNFATNAWGYFNDELTCAYTSSDACTAPSGKKYTPTGADPDRLVATPEIPELDTLAQFMFTARACKIAEEAAYADNAVNDHWAQNRKGIQPYLVRETQTAPLVPGDNHLYFMKTDFENAIRFSRDSHGQADSDLDKTGIMTIVFGTHEPQAAGDRPANPREEIAVKHVARVIPYCGILRFEIMGQPTTNTGMSGHIAIQEKYYEMLQAMWNDPNIMAHAECLVRGELQRISISTTPCNTVADSTFRSAVIETYQNYMREDLNIFIQQEIDNSEFDVNEHLKAKGWAGAALWYNRIAEMNGDISNIVKNVPTPVKYPYVLEFGRKKRMMSSEQDNLLSYFEPLMPDNERIGYERHADEAVAQAIYTAYKVWGDNEHYQGNVMIDLVNILFGTSGIFEMRRNADIHPLAQLSALGKSMFEASIRNIAISLPSMILTQSANTFEGVTLKSLGSFLNTVGTTTFAMSFVLYYVLPFLPFIYFIFAVSGWVKSIFEAVVAMPLWAVAHLRIDGEGIPGQAASNGYFLLFEIFLRPILILFGLLASIFIFTAMVKVMNEGVFDLILSNVAGFDRESETGETLPTSIEFYRHPIDQYFFTALYVIVVYMIGLSCFKLIDLIPNTILRWAGSSVAAFQENAGDPAGQVIQRTYSGALLATGQIQGGALAAL